MTAPRTMKMLCTGRLSLLGLVLASVGVSDAARETLAVTEGGVTFTGARYDDGRNTPYRLKFQQEDTRSLFMFNSASQVTKIKVGAERYKMVYDAGNNLESVKPTSSIRRPLPQEEEEYDVAAINGRRLEFDDCTTCGEAWDALCASVPLVCGLVDYGSPLSAAAAASVDTICQTFGSACSRFEASEACLDHCFEEDAVNACLDPTRGAYKCTFSGDTTMKFTNCDLVDKDVAYLPACFESFGKANIETLLLDESALTSIDEGIFAGLSEMTFLDLYSNKLVTVTEGLFDGLTKLEFLDLAWNDLVSLPVGAFSDLESLQTLRLFNNELTPESLPIGLFSGVPLLQALYLGRNYLGDMTGLVGLFDGLTELRSLGLSEAGVETVPAELFAGLSKLEYLSFWINDISSLPDGLLSDLSALQTLELSDNNLTDLGSSLSGLTELRTLLLEYNDLVLTEDVFSDLVNLEELDLMSCGLTTLPAGVFSPMVNLVSLDLGENEGLQCLPSTAATAEVDLDSEDVRDGTCECTPAEAVWCDDGLTCASGTTGYTCAA